MLEQDPVIAKAKPVTAKVFGRYELRQLLGKSARTMAWLVHDSKTGQDLVDALKAAGNDENSEAMQRALVFVSRCQNLKGEHNDQPLTKASGCCSR